MRFRGEGFTLVEVMISLAITAGLLITILYTLNYHLNIAGRQETLTTATLLARIKIQEMEKKPAVTRGYFKEPFSDYYYETDIRESSLPAMTEVSVVVRSGRESVRLAEVIPSRIVQ